MGNILVSVTCPYCGTDFTYETNANSLSDVPEIIHCPVDGYGGCNRWIAVTLPAIIRPKTIYKLELA